MTHATETTARRAYAITTRNSPRARSEQTGIRFCCGDESQARDEAEKAMREHTPRAVVTDVAPVAWVFPAGAEGGTR